MFTANLVDLVRRDCGARRHDVRLERQLGDEVDQSSRDMARVLVAKDSSSSQRAAQREQAVLLADALTALPADYGEVIVLHHLAGLSFPDVARRMGRSLDSVKKLWIRALARLRDALGGCA
jgi:RNA polymerase sigma-70 factor (ECF subfamily)